MERSRTVCEISWLALVIYGSSFLRVILEDYGLVMEEGLVLVADNESQARRYVSAYCQKTDGNGYRTTGWKRNKKYPENYCCSFLVIQKTTKNEEVETFLSEENFLPIVVAGGVIPEYLLSRQYIFRLREKELKDVLDKRFALQIEAFRSFIIKNIGEVENILEKFDSSIASTEYEGKTEYRGIFDIFAAVGSVYATFLRGTCSEREAVDFFREYLQETNERLQNITEFASGEELQEIFSTLVWSYVSRMKELPVADARELDGEVWKALKEKSAIIFDENFYFFPPELLMRICEPLLETVSEPELKRRLKEDGILSCNSADYTVKKLIINVYGVQARPRFLRVCKEALFSADNLRLEDVFERKEEDII